MHTFRGVQWLWNSLHRSGGLHAFFIYRGPTRHLFYFYRLWNKMYNLMGNNMMWCSFIHRFWNTKRVGAWKWGCKSDMKHINEYNYCIGLCYIVKVGVFFSPGHRPYVRHHLWGASCINRDEYVVQLCKEILTLKVLIFFLEKRANNPRHISLDNPHFMGIAIIFSLIWMRY